MKLITFEDFSTIGDIKEDVKQALITKDKIAVALESTVISHGLPYPENYQTVLKMEEIIRAGGGIPAVIGIIDGRIKIGMTAEEIHFLATDDSVRKMSRKDISIMVSQKMHGAATVSGTISLASLVGIELFVTGGLGGVHRFASETFDISADMEDLADCTMLGISAGVKSILDIPKTLEYMETKGIIILGYQTKDFPSFFCKRSGITLEHSVNTPQEAISIFSTKKLLNQKGSVVVVQGLAEEDEVKQEEIEKYLQQALFYAEKEGITSKKVTPFILDKINKLSSGRTLQANIKLLLNNAQLASEFARVWKARE